MNCPKCDKELSWYDIKSFLELYSDASGIQAEIECKECNSWVILYYRIEGKPELVP